MGNTGKQFPHQDSASFDLVITVLPHVYGTYDNNGATYQNKPLQDQVLYSLSTLYQYIVKHLTCKFTITILVY